MSSGGSLGPLQLLRRVVDARAGNVRAMQDLYHLRGVITFVAVFAATIALPAMLLAYYGIAGIRAEQRASDADVERAANYAAETLEADIQRRFVSFEATTLLRLSTGQSLNRGLGEIADGLRVVFRFDRDGDLVSPFRRGEATGVDDQEFYFSGSWAAAAAASQAAGSTTGPAANALHLKAASLYKDAGREARGERERAQASFQRAASLYRAGELRQAEAAFTEVGERYPGVRDAWGFRLGDLSRLKRGEILLSRDPTSGEQVLRALVEDLLSEQWTIGLGGEVAVARRSLDLVSGQASRDWEARRRTDLDERARQLFWAERLLSDLDSLGAKGKLLRVSAGEFSYVATEHALWAMTWTDDDQYVFGFDNESLITWMNALAERTSARSGDVMVSLVSPDARAPANADAKVRRALSPWLPRWTLVVYPRDPEALKLRQRDEFRRSAGIIVLSIFMIVVGAFLSVRLVQRELDSARTKSEFAANVSHELRSPITQIRLKAESLQLGLAETEESRSRHYDVIVREAERLSRMVDNMLDFAAIERGQKTYAMRPGDLGASVQNSVEISMAAMEMRGMDIELELPEDLPPVSHDPDAIAQVMTNLLSNAAKYGKEANWIGVRVYVDGGEVLVDVADRGIGIASAEQAAIFEQYYRSNDPKARRRKGTGIGLTVVKYIMDAHGGRITVRSSKGQGSTFTLHFKAHAGGSPDHPVRAGA